MNTLDAIEASPSVMGEFGFFKKMGTTAVLFVHGITGTPTEMKFFARQFELSGFTIACPQLKGHCGTFSELKWSRWEDWLESLRRCCLFLNQHFEKVFIVGLSLGAILGFKLSLMHDLKIDGIVALSPTLFFDGWNVSTTQWLIGAAVVFSPLRYICTFKDGPPYGIKDEYMRNRVMKILNGRKEVSKQIGHMQVPALTMYETVRLIRSVKKDLNKIKAPVLMVHSREDDLASLKNPDYLKKHLGSARVETLFIDDSYHVIPLDHKRDEVAQQAIQFIESI